MIRFFCLAWIILCANQLCHAQKNSLELDLDIHSKGEFLNESAYLDLVDGSKNFFLAIPTKSRVHFYLIDKDWKTKNHFISERLIPPPAQDVQDSIQTDDKKDDNICFYKKSYAHAGTIPNGTGQYISAFTKGEETIYLRKIDFANQTITSLPNWTTAKSEYLIHCFPYQEQLIWITTNRKTADVLSIYRYSSNGKIDTCHVSLDNYFTDKVPASIHYWNNNVSLMHPDRVSTLLNSAKRGKFFLYNGSLFIISDENEFYADITKLNLSTFQTEHFIFSCPGLDGEPTSNEFRDNHNSFLLNNQLYQANIHKGIFYFSITNINDTSQNKIYSFGKSDEIGFKNSPVIQIGTAFSPKDEKELFKSKQFIRKVNGNGLSILASLHNNIVQAQIGSSEVNNSGGGGGGGVYMPGATMGAGVGVSMPGHWSSFGGTGYQYTKTVYFFSIFDFKTMEHLSNENAYMDKIRTLSEFAEQNHYHIQEPLRIDEMILTGYLDTDSKKFKLVLF
jgi:hypothetical protein